MKGRTQLVLQEYFGIHKYFSISFRDEVVTVFLYKPCDREFCKIGGKNPKKPYVHSIFANTLYFFGVLKFTLLLTEHINLMRQNMKATNHF